MHILLLTVEMLLPVNSLKGKRGIVKSLISRSRQRFNVSAAEVDSQDNPGKAILAFSTVSSSGVYARQQLESLEEWICSERPDVEIIHSEIESL